MNSCSSAIPKVIHCCWFGGAKTALAEKCRASWMRFAPDFEIREWNEDGLGEFGDLPGYGFFRAAVSARAWAAASDWARMAALYRDGGVYLDFDVELVGGLDELCRNGEWVAGEWTANGGVWMNPGSGIALEKGSGIALSMLEAYHQVTFDRRREMMCFINEQLSAAASYYQGQFRVLPPEVFSPIDAEGHCHRTEKTVGIHHYAMSWATFRRRFARWMSWHGMHGLVAMYLKWTRRSGFGRFFIVGVAVAGVKLV